MKAIVFFLVLTSWFWSCKAQKPSSVSQEFTNAKQLVDQGAYPEALPTLLKLSSETPKNTLFKESSYLYAIASIKNGNYSEAFQMLKQIEVKYPQFQASNVLYHQAVSLFYLKEYDKALLTCSKIDSKRQEQDIRKLKIYFISQYKDTDKLTELYNRNSKDKEVAEVLFNKLNEKGNNLSPKEKSKIAEIAAEYKFKSASTNTKSTEVKHVGILLPYEALKANHSKNYLFFDFQAGLSLGFDSLNKEKKQIELHYYNIEKDTNAYLNLINSEEYQNLDLVIGPVFNNLSNLSIQNLQTDAPISINPFANSTKFNASNASILYNAPSVETIGTQTANMCASQLVNKKVVIFYNNNGKDSLAAYAFKSTFEKLYGKILAIKSTKKTSYTSVLTESLKDSIGAVVVFSNTAIVATNILTALEVIQCHAPIIAPKEWLDINSLTLQKYEKHNLHFIFQNYYSNDDLNIQKFNVTYFNKFNLYPSEYSYIGYDLATYFGNKLIQYGKEFPQKIQQENTTTKGLLQGYNYYQANSNQALQFVKFEHSKLVPIVDFSK